MANQVRFGVNSGDSPEPQPRSGDTPFRMLIIGDFSGRANRGIRQIHQELARRSAVQIDRDNFDDVLNRFNVSLDHTIVDSSDQPVSVRFRELDDFEPDQLFEAVELFESLRSTRQQLHNQSTFQAAAAEVRRWADVEEKPEAKPPSTDTPASTAQQDVSLDNLLSGTMQQQKQTADTEASRWQTMIRDLVDPLIVAGPDPQLGSLVDCVDSAISQSMRQLLHHPDFQQLESAWRGLYLLIRRLETDRSLQIHLLDISQPEIAADVQVDNLSDSGLYRLIVEQTVGTAGAEPWSAIIGTDSYSASTEDITVLAQLSRIAAAAGAPFIGTARGEVIGCPDPQATPDPDDWQTPQTSDNEQWQDLLNHPGSSYIELLWPRFTGRLPYGRDGRSVDAFDFEELSTSPRHDDYLWCSPAYAAALVLAQSFTHFGWNMQPGQIDEVDDLPVRYAKDENGDLVQLPTTETWLSDRAIEQIRKSGITPLVSVKAQAAIRVGAFRALNSNPLAGGWQ